MVSDEARLLKMMFLKLRDGEWMICKYKTKKKDINL